MHELGHNVNLFHGGNERFLNCKPNYISVMNYLFSVGQFVGENRLDFFEISTPTTRQTGIE